MNSPSACIALLGQIERVNTKANGIAITGQGSALSADEVAGYVDAVAATEVSVSQQAGTAMQPLVVATQVRLNSVAPEAPSVLRRLATDRLKEINADTPEGWDALRAQFVEAVRQELAV